MEDVKMIHPNGLTKMFRFVTPAALTILMQAGWSPVG